MQRHCLAVIVVLGSSLQHHDSFAVAVVNVIAKTAARFKSYLGVHYYAVIKQTLIKIMFNNYVTIATEAVGADICFAVCYFHKQSPLFILLLSLYAYFVLQANISLTAYISYLLDTYRQKHYTYANNFINKT